MSDAHAHGHDEKKKTFAEWLGTAFVYVLLLALFFMLIGPVLEMLRNGAVTAINFAGMTIRDVAATFNVFLTDITIAIRNVFLHLVQIGLITFISFGICVFLWVLGLKALAKGKQVIAENKGGGGGKKDDHHKAEHH